MLFAAVDAESLTLSGALTIITIAVANWIQSQSIRRQAKAGAKEGAEVGSHAAVEPMKRSMDGLEAAVNGDGLGGRLTKVEQRITGLERAVDEIPKKAAIEALKAIRQAGG